MSSEQILSNARIVTAEREFLGSVLLRDGLIVEDRTTAQTSA